MDRFKELIQSPKPVLVDFYAEWCGPCQIMKPRLLDVAERMGEKAKIVEIDVDREKNLPNVTASSRFLPLLYLKTENSCGGKVEPSLP